jgi:hypothetical protein
MTMLQILILLSVTEMTWPFSPQDEWDEISNRYPDYCG